MEFGMQNMKKNKKISNIVLVILLLLFDFLTIWGGLEGRDFPRAGLIDMGRGVWYMPGWCISVSAFEISFIIFKDTIASKVIGLILHCIKLIFPIPLASLLCIILAKIGDIYPDYSLNWYGLFLI